MKYVDKVSNEILSKEEQDELKKFNLNEPMKQAVKKVILLCIYNNGVLKPSKKADTRMNFMLNIAWQPNKTPDLIKEEMMVAAKGAELLERGFKLIDHFKEKETNNKDKTNPAR